MVRPMRAGVVGPGRREVEGLQQEDEEQVQAEKEVREYERRRTLAGGSLAGGVGAGAAPRAPPIRGGSAGSAAAPPPPLGAPPARLALALGGPGWSAASSQASRASWPSPDVRAMVKALDLRPSEGGYVPPPPPSPPPNLESKLFAPDTGDNKWGGAVLALPSQVLGAPPSQVGGPHAAVAKGLEQQVDKAEWSLVTEGGDASKGASVASTPDSDAEMDALVERTYAKQQYHKLCDQQRELIEHERK